MDNESSPKFLDHPIHVEALHLMEQVCMEQLYSQMMHLDEVANDNRI